MTIEAQIARLRQVTELKHARATCDICGSSDHGNAACGDRRKRFYHLWHRVVEERRADAILLGPVAAGWRPPTLGGAATSWDRMAKPPIEWRSQSTVHAHNCAAAPVPTENESVTVSVDLAPDYSGTCAEIIVWGLGSPVPPGSNIRRAAEVKARLPGCGRTFYLCRRCGLRELEHDRCPVCGGLR